MAIRAFILAVFVFTFGMYKNCRADDMQALAAITQFAKDNCEEVKQSGDASSEKFKGSVDAGVSGLFKRFAKADAQGDIEQETKTFSGMVQNELPSALKDVRACKQHIIDLLVPKLLSKSSSNDRDALARHLAAGNDPIPTNPCTSMIQPDGLVVLLGNDAFIALNFPHTILQIAGKDVIAIRKHEDGSLGLDMEVMGEDGRGIVKIVDNRFELNLNNYYSLRQESNHLEVYSLDKQNVLNLTYINAQAVRITAILNYHSVPVKITDENIQIGKNYASISDSCIIGAARDIVVR